MTIQLEEIFDRPVCERCKSGALRPIDVVSGHVQVRCSTRGCIASMDFRLPSLHRKIIYLDTSTVSHTALATSGPYARLRQALGDAVYKNVIGCVASSVVRSEVELASDSESILAVCRELGTIRPNHQLRVEEAQIYRAFGRYLCSEQATREVRPPREDAFDEDVDEWHGMLSFHTRFAIPASALAQRRGAKAAILADFVRIYGKYAAENLTFQQIEKRETDGLCDFLCGDLTFHKLVTSSTYRAVNRAEAECQVRSFLQSEHIRLLPFAVINGKLHAALALAFRNANARRPKSGDAADIEHLRTYLPYVDVFITDTYMAGVANQGNLRLGDEYGAQVRSLGEGEADAFIEWLSDLTSTSATANLSARIYEAISAGGYLQEFATFASRYVSQMKSE